MCETYNTSMAAAIKQLGYWYNEFEKISDPRLNDSFLSSPIPVWIITAIYYYFIFYGGRKFMEKRKPFDLKKYIIVYNFLQVVCNGVIFLKAVTHISHFWGLCLPVDYSGGWVSVLISKYAKWYFYLKIADYMDTVFFVLRKKYTHVTFLHVYHHILMVVFGWVGLKVGAGGHAYYVGLFNSFVHSVMYLYYLLAALELTKAYVSPYKKYVTQLQLVQFVGLTAIFSVASVLPSSCTIPKFMVYSALVQNFFMIWLFSNFYYQTYIEPTKSKTH